MHIIINIKKYVHLWWTLTVHSFQTSLTNRFNAGLFLIGKILRFGLFILFLFTLFSNTRALALYSFQQTLLFFLTFNLIDTTAQLFFREVYRFRPLVVSGDFDLVLVKPMNPLFRALAGGADPLDLLMLFPYVGLIAYVAYSFGSITPLQVALYCIFLFNGFLIATGFHIFVLALAVVTTEIDHAVMIYRDLTSMGRIPVDIYREPIRSILMFVLPVGLMMTVPAKVLLGILDTPLLFITPLIGVLFLVVSIRVWCWSLTKYSSASS